MLKCQLEERIVNKVEGKKETASAEATTVQIQSKPTLSVQELSQLHLMKIKSLSVKW